MGGDGNYTDKGSNDRYEDLINNNRFVYKKSIIFSAMIMREFIINWNRVF